MLHATIESLAALAAAPDLLLGETPRFVRDYAGSVPVREALARVNAPVHTARATGSLYLDQRLELIEESDGWMALVLRVPPERRSVSTAAGPSVVHLLEAPAPLAARSYRVAGFPENGDLPGGMRLEEGEGFAVAPGDTFIIPAGPRAVSLHGPLAESRFLRFSGPTEAPITVSFEAGDDRPRAVAFTDQEASGRQFFAALLFDLVRGTPGQAPLRLDEEDLASVRGFIDMGLGDDTHLVTKWKLAQLAGRISPARARDFFVELARSGHANASAQAARILERLEGAAR